MKIFIEGNIGSGKSTLINFLKKEFTSIKVLPEPVEEWKQLKDNNNKNILHYFYKDIKRWSYTFQMNAFITRSKIIEQHKNEDFIMERSVFSDKNCFAINCYENKLLSDIEWKLYNQWHDWLSTKCSLKADAYIYLRTNPEIAYKRIQKRNRKEEDEIPLEYIKQIHKKHDEWLYKRDENILVLDGNIENTPERLIKFKKLIKEFLKKIRIKLYSSTSSS